MYQNGVNYEYEAAYKFDTRTEEYAQYHPDLYLPDYDVYIEYFGINKSGDVPTWFSGKNGKSATSYHEIEKLAGEYNKLAQAVDNNKITNEEYQTQVNKLNKEFKQHKNVIRQAGEDTLSFGDKIKQYTSESF